MARDSKIPDETNAKDLKVDPLASLAHTKATMAVLLRVPLKPHSEMKIGKQTRTTPKPTSKRKRPR
jgi:hypothetical protein